MDQNFYQNMLQSLMGSIPQSQPPKREIVKVNGEEGVKAYSLAPNSSDLLLDMNDPIVWVVQTDGAGYKTYQPFNITPFVPDPPVKESDMNAKLTAIDERLKMLEERIRDNAKSDHANASAV